MADTETIELDLDFAATVPVGHRVRVSCFAHEPDTSMGRFGRLLFGSEREKFAWVVDDLQTGIRYAPARLFESRAVDGRLRYSSTICPSFRAESVSEAIVAGCTLLSRSGNAGNHRLSTLMTIAIESGRLRERNTE